MSNLKNDLKDATDRMADALHRMAVNACEARDVHEVAFLMKQLNTIMSIERHINRRIDNDTSIA